MRLGRRPLGLGGSLASPPTRGVRACPVLGSDSDSDVDRISEWKRRDEERRRELEEKRKREQEEEIRRLREQEKEEKEKRKEKAEKGEEAHSDSDSSADDEVAKKGRKGRAKAPSSSDSDLEMEKEVSAMLGGAGGAGGRQQQPVLSLPRQQEPPGAPGPAVLAFFYPGEHGEGLCATGSCVLAQEAPSSSHPCDALSPQSLHLPCCPLQRQGKGRQGSAAALRRAAEGSWPGAGSPFQPAACCPAQSRAGRAARRPEPCGEAWLWQAGWALLTPVLYPSSFFYPVLGQPCTQSSWAARSSLAAVLLWVLAAGTAGSCPDGAERTGAGAGRGAASLPPAAGWALPQAALACIVLSLKVKKPAKKQPSELSRKPNQKEKRGRAEEKPRNKSASPLLCSSGARAAPRLLPQPCCRPAGWGWGPGGAGCASSTPGGLPPLLLSSLELKGPTEVSGEGGEPG